MTDRDDFVARSDAACPQREVQRRRAVRDGAGVRRTDVLGELTLEGRHFRSLREPATAKRPGDRFDLPIVHKWRGNGNPRRDRRRHHRTHPILAHCSSCHQATSVLRPSIKLIDGWYPINCCAWLMSARRRGTGFTLRSGACSGVSVESIAASNCSASWLSDVSLPLAMFSATSVAGAAAASRLARATSRTCTKSIV